MYCKFTGRLSNRTEYPSQVIVRLWLDSKAQIHQFFQVSLLGCGGLMSQARSILFLNFNLSNKND